MGGYRSLTHERTIMGKSISTAAHLAMGMHAQPRVYAVLLGSGVSTGAGLPTGWGVEDSLFVV